MGGLGVPIGILAMVLGRGGVLLGLIVLAQVVMMGGFAVMMGRGLMVRGGRLMVLARCVLLFL